MVAVNRAASGPTEPAGEELPAAAMRSSAYARSLFDILIALETGVLSTFAGFLLPGLSRRTRVLCWQSAAVGLSAATSFTCAHLREFHWPTLPRIRRAPV